MVYFNAVHEGGGHCGISHLGLLRMGWIVIDVSAAVNSKAGLGRYAETLVTHLRSTQVGPRLHLFYNRRPGGVLPQSLEGFPARRVSLGYKPWRLIVWLAHLTHLPFDRLLPANTALFHATEHLLPPLRSIPTVLTVHDLIFERFPQYHKRLNRLFLTHAMPLFARRATTIITISQASRRDLVALYGVSPQKIHVIYEAPAPHFRPQPAAVVEAVRRRYGLPERYILTVGTIEPRKNLSRLLAAFERVHAQGLVDTLVIVGQRGWLYEDFLQRLVESPARDAVILPGFVPDTDLAAMYTGATVFALPSLYEGFGLPVLEAMACGAPVLTSRAGALPEVGGDAALYVDPEDEEAIAAGLERYLRDSELRAEMRERGFKQADQFSWERTAQETLRVYQQLL